MMTLGKNKLLKIYIDEFAKVKHTPLFEAIVFAAKKEKLAGATVYRGIMSYGPGDVIHMAKWSDLISDLPVIIEIIDEEEKIENFIKKYIELFEIIGKGGLITLTDVEVRYYKADK
jgi:uncharacterized protein